AAYALMNLGAFAVVTIFEREGRGAMLEDYAGLIHEKPALASALPLFVFSLAGIPPPAVFMGKFYLFGAAVRAGLTPLAVIAVLTSVIGVYYYLRVVVTVVFREPDVAWTRSARATWGPALAILLAVAGTLLFGIFPAMLHDVAI